MTAIQQKRILLGMLISNGDCLMTTVIAKQIKNDYPGCHLTWAISNFCRQAIENNPLVDEIWEIPLSDKNEAMQQGWYRFYHEAMQKKKEGFFDEAFFTQIYPSNVHHFDGTTRGTIYNSYPGKITVDARPVLRLYDQEKEKVKQYAGKHRLSAFRHVMLFECSSLSEQSFVTPDWALKVAGELVKQFEDLLIIISTHLNIPQPHERILVANNISFRENAALTHYCTLLVGCSSGITWAATSDAAKHIPTVQFLKSGIGFRFASVAYDHRYWGLDDSHIIEVTNKDKTNAVKIIADVLQEGVALCRPKYNEVLRPRFISLLKYWFMFFRKGKFGKSFNIVWNFLRRNYIRKRN
ncbi:MAG: hypothetical protein EPN92_10430 [Chitinophagaceae bacterium]|nr:MAG: hypothetical protein EPN92_10430 [Chitinophagaceae bacterium]